MTIEQLEYHEKWFQLNELHFELAELYYGKSTDRIQIGRLWNQIERLERELGFTDNYEEVS